MPEFNPLDKLVKSAEWKSSESIMSSSSSGFHSPTSSCSSSTSPDNTLRRRKGFRRSATIAGIKQEHFVIHSDHRDSRSHSPVLTDQSLEEDGFFNVVSGIIGWYPCLLICLIRDVVLSILPHTVRQVLTALPMLWISMWIWCLTQLVQFPLNIVRIILSFMLASGTERTRTKRTVLISGGSTIQALHLARNFYSAGARVIVCEVEGIFALTRWSTAVHKFYTIPKPSNDHVHRYIKALCEIVDKEEVLYYIPVSATTPAYFDSLAKPRLENLGCSCFCPNVEQIWALDDTLEVLKLCQKHKIPTPVFHVVTSMADLMRLYDNGAIRLRNVITAAGPCGLRERHEMVLPLSKRELKIPGEMSELRPWVVIQDLAGEHYSTCTTLKDSKVIANVTCLTEDANGLIPTEHPEIERWIAEFFAKLSLPRPITGHISFRFLATSSGLVPVGCRVGVGLPYVCYTAVHPRLIWRPCRHFTRQASGPLVNSLGSYCLPESIIEAAANPGVASVTRLVGKVLDRREVLFAVWDPLPYCAYYHLQLPFRNTLGFLQRRRDSFPTPMATTVR